ncbi:MAG: lipopolysaccharide assembly protein LapA domain-containing protein [OM182 bacterium]
MRKILRILTGLFLLAVLVLSLGFMSANDTLISLSFGALQSQDRPVGLWIAASFVLGGLLGLMAGLRLFSSLFGRLEIARLRSRLAKLEAVNEAKSERTHVLSKELKESRKAESRLPNRRLRPGGK